MLTLLARNHIRRTRVEHRCCWCKESIPIGEQMIVTTWVDGHVQHDYKHPECDAAESRDSCYTINGWLEDGEACSEDHDRGKTCDETMARQKEEDTLCT